MEIEAVVGVPPPQGEMSIGRPSLSPTPPPPKKTHHNNFLFMLQYLATFIGPRVFGRLTLKR